MSFLQRLSKAKIVFIAYEFNPSGGSCVSVNNYFNYWKNKGALVEKVSRNSRLGFIKVLIACLFGKRLVFNGLYCFNFIDLTLLCLLRKDSVVYLHESEYAINDFEKQSPYLFSLFQRIVRSHKVACITKLQEDYLKSRFGQVRSEVVYNTLPFINKSALSGEGVKILMVGYLMQRKGVDFYSKLADYATNKGENWKFYWIGSKVENKPLYLSDNVNWLGLQTSPHYYYEKIDVFFLASVDEPMGLVCAEALMHYKKCTVYKNTGFAELINNIEGCSIYEEYTVESAYSAIRQAIETNVNTKKVDEMLANYFSVEEFSKRMDVFISA